VTPRAEMTAVLGAIAVGALVSLVVAAQPRVSTAMAGGQVTGADTPVAGALSLVALAGVAAVLLVRNRARRAVGTLLVVVAVGIVAAYLAPADALTYAVFAAGDAPDVGIGRSVWAWLGVAGGVVAALGSLAVTARAGRWPEPRRRFEAPAPARQGSEDPWEALDRGEDPTR
jgi:Tryptophan-associated transmembrane protein (Trp_oprn_chp)